MAKKKKLTVRNGRPLPNGAAVQRVEPEILHYAVPVLVFMSTVLTFIPSLQNGFVTWDDDKTLLANFHYRGLGWSQLEWMFTTFHMGNYRPLTWMTFAFDYLLWGMDPRGYHLTNVLIHGANGILFYWIAERVLALAFPSRDGSDRLTLRLAAGFAALSFSIHPLRVEPVAWLSARNHLLAGTFSLAMLLCYLHAATDEADGAKRRVWLGGAIVCYLFSLLSQPGGITLPFVLLVLDVYPLRRLGTGPGGWFGPEARSVWREKSPFLLLALGGSLAALLAKSEVGAMQSLSRYGLFSRVWQASFGLAFYLWKTIIPANLSPLYETPAYINPLTPSFLVSVVCVIALTVILVIFRRYWPAGLGAWLCYAALLAPFLGLAQSGPQFVADRYSYLACLGFSLLAGAGMFFLCRSRGGEPYRRPRIVVSRASCLGILALLIVLTLGQIGVWHDSESLWRQVLAIDPGSSIGNNNMGNVLLKQGKTAEAIAHYRRALEADPKYAEAYFDLATALSSMGQMQTAIEQFETGLRLNPNHAQARYYLGRVFAKEGHVEQAIREFRRSVKLDPEQSGVRYDLGTALVMSGNLPEAIEQFRQAIALQPDYAEAHYSLGRVLAAQGRLSEAAEEFRQTIRLEPQFAEARASLERVMMERQRPGAVPGLTSSASEGRVN